MPLRNFKTYLQTASLENWALGQFNISNLEILQGIIRAALKLKSPVIIGTSLGESEFVGLKQAAALVNSFNQGKKRFFCLNLDHGENFDYIKRAIVAGYDAVHFDGSKLPLDKNIEIAKKIISFASRKNVLVEGEVGVIGGQLTDPKEAGRFVRETKVSSLAINVGTFHGFSKKGKPPQIDFYRLRAIKSQTGNVPLVLHGGSGLPDSEIKKAVKAGIAKININTELRNVFTQNLKKSLLANPKEITPYKYLPKTIEAVQRAVEKKIKLFGSINKI